MEKQILIEEISKNLKDLPVAFSHLEPIRNCSEGLQVENKLPDNNISISNFKPMRIDQYQTPDFMMPGGIFYKPISRFFSAKKLNNRNLPE
jgi:hypothetical protein